MFGEDMCHQTQMPFIFVIFLRQSAVFYIKINNIGLPEKETKTIWSKQAINTVIITKQKT